MGPQGAGPSLCFSAKLCFLRYFICFPAGFNFFLFFFFSCVLGLKTTELSFFSCVVYLWLHWVLIAVCWLSLVVESGGPSLVVHGLLAPVASPVAEHRL